MEGNVHYLPHTAVVKNDRETTKVRIVFDASSKANRGEPSLNECLYSGPCTLPLIYDILLKFRLGKIGIVSDVQQAFLNIEIAEEHRNLLRFLWYKDVTAEERELIILRFARVLFGLTSSPFLLNGTIYIHLTKYVEEGIDVAIILKLLLDLYMDDSSTSVNSVEEGKEFHDKAKWYLAKGGFNLRKWDTNSVELRKLIYAMKMCWKALQAVMMSHTLKMSWYE